jgi:hypothetical protein
MKRAFMIFIVAVLSPCSTVLGQITVTTNEFAPPPGTELAYPSDLSPSAAFFNTLAAGSGGPMTWDFSSRDFGNPITNVSVELATTPDIDSFPTANVVLYTPVTAIDSAWQVFQSEASSFTTLGTVSHVFSAEAVLKYVDYTPEWTFPLAYNDQWTSYRHATTPGVDNYTRLYDTTDYVADAWGTAKYMSREVPCLRVHAEERATTEVYDLQDNLIGSTTITTTSLHFVAAGFDRVAGATRVSVMGFNSYSISASAEFVSTSTGVREADGTALPTGFTLSQNYPNPFNPSTEISFTLPTRAHVRLTVYDLLGREVVHLVDRDMPAGAFVADWDGRNSRGEAVATGVYFYKLAAGKHTQTRKMLLLK